MTTESERVYREVGRAPFPTGEGILYETLKNAFKNRFAMYRELIVNALDQYEHKELKGKVKPQVIVRLDSIRNQIWIHDDFTGIENIKDFLRFGTIDATGNTGKTVGDEISTRMNIHENIAGMKHLGKGSAVFTSKIGKVEFWSNSGNRGYYLKTDKLTWVEFQEEAQPLPYVIVNTSELPEFRRSSKGLTIRISEAYPDVLNFEKVENAIVDWLGLKIARGAKIYLENVNNPEKSKYLTKPKDLDTKEDAPSPMLILNSGRRIRTCLRPVERPEYLNITVYCRQIKVKRIHVHRKVKGWIENPELELAPGREDIVEDDPLGAYVDHVDKIEPFWEANFEPIGVDHDGDVKHREDKSLNKVVNLLQERFTQMFPTYERPVYGVETQAVAPVKGTEDIPRTEDAKIKEIVDKEPFMENVKYIQGGGSNICTEKIITRGPGRKGGDNIDPVDIQVQTDGESNDNGRGNDPIKKIVVKADEETKRHAYKVRTVMEIETTQPAKPNIKVKTDPRKTDDRNVFVDDRDIECRWIIVNTAKHTMREAWESGQLHRYDLLMPLIVKAQVNFNISDKQVGREEYEKMLDKMYETVLELRGGS